MPPRPSSRVTLYLPASKVPMPILFSGCTAAIVGRPAALVMRWGASRLSSETYAVSAPGQSLTVGARRKAAPTPTTACPRASAARANRASLPSLLGERCARRMFPGPHANDLGVMASGLLPWSAVDDRARDQARDRLAAVGEIAVEVAHELRNVLQIISASAYVARDEASRGDAAAAASHLVKVERN